MATCPGCSRLYADLFLELVGTTASPAPDPGPAETVVDAGRYCGRYELRNKVADVTVDGSGRLWLTQEERNEAATMAALAGVGLQTQVTEARRVDGETFLRLGPDGQSAGVVEFIDVNGSSGRAGYLHDGRAAPRVGESAT